MATVRVYTLTAIGPAGDSIEVSIVAESAIAARQKAQDAGLTRIVVGPYREVEASEIDSIDPPRGSI